MYLVSHRPRYLFLVLLLFSAVLPAWSDLDDQVGVVLVKAGTTFAEPCPDEVFLRRVYLDLCGTLPRPEETESFLRSKDPGKRSALVDELLGREEYADYWALRWGDVLRVKSEFPINLWPNAVQAYHRWLRDAVKTNLGYDRFARALLTSSGSNFRDPPVNFYRAVPARDPGTLAKAAALTFLGTRLETWPPAAQADLAAFFSRVTYKRTLEWKEEIVYSDPLASGELRLRFPDGGTVVARVGEDPRTAFADWLLAPGNPWFTRALVNRVWYWLLGTAPVEPADALAWAPGGKPAGAGDGEGLLAFLETEFRRSGCDIRALIRLIAVSRTYQQSAVRLPEGYSRAPAFARYTLRRLDAEILADAFTWIGGVGPNYVSPIPEPFTFVPDTERSIALTDGSISSSFLVRFGRPARDTGLLSERDNRATEDQALYLLNSNELKKRIDASPVLKPVYMLGAGRQAEQVRRLYFILLSRFPSPGEAEAAAAYYRSAGDPGRAVRDLAWALINGKEFLYRH